MINIIAWGVLIVTQWQFVIGFSIKKLGFSSFHSLAYLQPTAGQLSILKPFNFFLTRLFFFYCFFIYWFYYISNLSLSWHLFQTWHRSTTVMPGVLSGVTLVNFAKKLQILHWNNQGEECTASTWKSLDFRTPHHSCSCLFYMTRIIGALIFSILHHYSYKWI